MHRIVFQIGPFTLYSYGFFVAAGFLLSTVLILRDAGKFGLSRESVFDCLIAVILGGLIGGRALFVIINWGYYSRHLLDVVMFHRGGLAFQGALAGAVFAGGITARIKGLPFWRTGDLICPYIPLGHALGRVGCFLNGCCYGKIIESGVGVTFPGETVMRVPTQIYSSFFLLLLSGFLILFREKRRFEGQVFLVYLIIYSGFRFLIDFYRGDDLAMLYGIKLSQVISLGMFALGVMIYLVLKGK
ncbi:MAG: prolipoprotein diacylglyceryl transferase, partial [Candidatus Omnitrophota bacterium]|nr:prolipoprotein diacylglyceryl transferase [Candidatus Omnitrophota bacterium]